VAAVAGLMMARFVPETLTFTSQQLSQDESKEEEDTLSIQISTGKEENTIEDTHIEMTRAWDSQLPFHRIATSEDDEEEKSPYVGK